MRVWIVSFGGVCCTHLITALRKENYVTNQCNDKDRLKHLPSPESTEYTQNIDKYDKILYVYNDPLLAILSHFRRKWVHEAHTKINKTPSLSSSICKQYSSFENHTILTGSDVFGCKTHFDEWYSFKHKTPILFVDPRDPDVEKHMQAFLGISVPFNLTSRRSSKSGCKDQMITIYDNLDKSIQTKIRQWNETTTQTTL